MSGLASLILAGVVRTVGTHIAVWLDQDRGRRGEDSGMEKSTQTRTAELMDPASAKTVVRYARIWWVFLAALPGCCGIVMAATLIPRTAWTTVLPSEIAIPLGGAAFAMGTAAIAMLIWRIILVARYRPHPTLDDDTLPTMTVIIPAYNEGRQVAETIRSVLASDYPIDRLEVVAVNDGSRDDTWTWIQTAQAEAPERVRAIHYSKNQGKRYALNRGFLSSRGRVIVTVDSDSEVAPDALRNLASPFVDDRVGAVAGSVRVLNTEQGAIARMLDVAFTFSFDFVRASQSAVNTVFCTPGALSAYRRDLVMAVRTPWLTQTFLSRPAGIGEDRAMTNLILSKGFHVVFQGNAVVYTEVPVRLPQLSRMLLRWARSNIRESFVTAGFIFRRYRTSPVWGSRLMFMFDVATLIWTTTVAVPAVLLLLLQPIGVPLLLFAVFVGSIPPAMVYALLQRPRHAPWAFAYGLYALVALSWIKPYAALTVWRNGWLTRALPVPRFDSERATSSLAAGEASEPVEPARRPV